MVWKYGSCEVGFLDQVQLDYEANEYRDLADGNLFVSTHNYEDWLIKCYDVEQRWMPKLPRQTLDI